MTQLDDWSTIRRMTRNATRTELIKVGTEIIASHGFSTTGINTVLKKAGIPKGSFYYYFPSKEAFGLAVIDFFASEYAKKLAGFLNDDRFSPLRRIRNYLDEGVSGMSECQCMRGCAIGNLSQELASQNEIFRARLDAVFRDWQGQFARCLAEARDRGEITRACDVGQLAEFLLSGWEGAILRAKVMKSVAPMQSFIKVLFDGLLKMP